MSSLSFDAISQHRSISSSPTDALENRNRKTRPGDRKDTDALFAISVITRLDEWEYIFLMSYPPNQL